MCLVNVCAAAFQLNKALTALCGQARQAAENRQECTWHKNKSTKNGKFAGALNISNTKNDL